MISSKENDLCIAWNKNIKEIKWYKKTIEIVSKHKSMLISIQYLTINVLLTIFLNSIFYKMAALAIAGIVIDELILTGMAVATAIGLYYGFQKAKTKQEAQTLSSVASKHKNESPEEHLPWSQLQSYQGKVKRGYSSKGKLYYYQKDMLHGDVEVYKLAGSKGIHIGCVAMEGGTLTKPPVPGRTIQL